MVVSIISKSATFKNTLMMFFLSQGLSDEVFFDENDEYMKTLFEINSLGKSHEILDEDDIYKIKGLDLIYDDNFDKINAKYYVMSEHNAIFYRSHKYFLNTNTINKIQKLICNNIKCKYNTIGIYFDDTNFEYYTKSINKINMSDSEIYIFGNNEKAKIFFKDHKLDMTFFDDNSESIIKFSQCDIKICTYSVFCLCCCYLADMLNLETTKNYFPENLDGVVDYKFDQYDIYDLIPINNNKYEILITNNEIYGIFLVATGNYKQYLENIIINIKNNFLTQNKKILLISTDDVEYIEQFNYLTDDNMSYVVNKIYQIGFPGDTLYRFEYFLKFIDKNIDVFEVKTIYDIDYLLFMNLNMELFYKIDTLSLNKYQLFFTLHPRNKFDKVMNDHSLENDLNSSAWFEVSINHKYICGGFNGGVSPEYLKMAHILAQNICNDDLNNIVARWHDETQLNWYLNYISKTNIKYKILSYYYCSPNHKPYIANPYMSPITKTHDKIRKHDYYILQFTDSVVTDIHNVFYTSCTHDVDIGLEFYNKYNNSSRQGIFKNFYRSENIKNEEDRKSVV